MIPRAIFEDGRLVVGMGGRGGLAVGLAMVWLVGLGFMVAGVYIAFRIPFLSLSMSLSFISVCVYESGLCQGSDCVCLASFFVVL